MSYISDPACSMASGTRVLSAVIARLTLTVSLSAPHAVGPAALLFESPE